LQNDAWSTRSASLGYPWMAGSNASPTFTGITPYNVNSELFSIKVNTPAGYDGISKIVVGFEAGYTNWEHSGHFILTCADSAGVYQEIVPTSTTLKTSAGAPTWPAWSTSLAPSWPTVTDAGGNFIWVNRGPASDFAWSASTPFTLAGTTVNGFNGYKESPYRAGKSGSVEPSWSTTVGALKTDSTSLVWRNVGGYTASTSFDFSVRNATIDIAYLPSGVVNTRAAATDEIDMAVTQKLSKIQVRYGLTLGGEVKVYQVWVEATAG
jgi:LysM repeat protein